MEEINVTNEKKHEESESNVQNLDPKTTEDPPKTHVVKWKRPYTFEHQEYTEVDLSGLDTMTIQDAIDAQKRLYGREVASSMLCETTTAFACALAAKASEMPIEFFKLMPRFTVRKIKRAILEYVNIENDTENGVMKLCEPYSFEGKTYTEIDLSGLADLTALQETTAENTIAQEGFIITENSFNYLYACTLAAMATQLPEKFFTGLPLRELTKLKLVVNDSSFFE